MARMHAVHAAFQTCVIEDWLYGGAPEHYTGLDHERPQRRDAALGRGAGGGRESRRGGVRVFALAAGMNDTPALRVARKNSSNFAWPVMARTARATSRWARPT